MIIKKPIREKQFQSQVVELARLCGWWVYHTFDSRRSQKGFPDLVLIRGSMLIFAELKSESGNLTKEQKEVLGKLEGTKGPYVFVWRPSDWPEIERILTKAGRKDADKQSGKDFQSEAVEKIPSRANSSCQRSSV